MQRTFKTLSSTSHTVRNCYCARARTSKRLLSKELLFVAHPGVMYYATGARTPQHIKITVGERELEITTGDLARLANGSATAKIGETMVLATAVADFSQRSLDNFLPMTVDYRHKAAAAGRIPTNFLRRELGASHSEILKSRMIDRCLRPMFPKSYNCETQIVCNLLSFDRINSPDVLAINAASVALSLSDIPCCGAVGAVRIGMVDGVLVVNPNRQEMLRSSLDLIVAALGNRDLVMLEAGAMNIPLQDMRKAIKHGVKHAAQVGREIDVLAKKSATKEKIKLVEQPHNSELTAFLRSDFHNAIERIFLDAKHDKKSRDLAIRALKKNAEEEAIRVLPGTATADVKQAYDSLVKSVLRNLILKRGTRPDGRSATDLRPISCAVDVYKPLHGSAFFQRGQTQVIASVTLDSLEAMSKSDPVTEILVGRSEKNFMLHYEFPQYATGDIAKPGGINRREIGHGALAERGLRPVIPDDFSFTIRVAAEVLESNGSSSMASVCAGSLALLDAGVQLTEPAAGIAMGLITEHNESGEITDYKILTDLLGLEDYAGDMDFKVAGTKSGFTALQLDFKIPGVPVKIIMEALQQAHDGKHEILKIMNDCICTARADSKATWPVSDKFVLPANKRSRVVGLGGANIKRVQQQTGVRLTSNSDGSFDLFAPNQQSLAAARVILEELAEQKNIPALEFGNVYAGKIVELQKNGVLVQIHPDMSPVFVRNSQLDSKKIMHSEAAGLPLGETIYIKYFGTDPVTGEERFSRKALLTTGGHAKNFLPKSED